MSQTATSVSPATLRKVISAASIGNFVEWFDFALYGFLATLLAAHFFPSGDATAGLLKTFAVFAVAFAFRPLGGIVFGLLGDRIGRKRTLALTILIMAGATALIGILPSYATIGIWAPILLTLIRCAQGFSAGGEYAGACAYVMEHSPRDRRGRYGSFVPVSTFLAFASAALTAWGLERLLGAAAMADWGWRIPFLAAAPLGLIGLYLRLKLDETPAFQALEADHEVSHSPLGAFISLTALSFYMFTTYFSTYLQLAGGFDRAAALAISLITLFAAAAACPVLGRVTDRIGRRMTTVLASLVLAVGVYPALLLASSGQFGSALLGSLLLGAGAVLCNVVTAPLLSEVFPTRTRYTAGAITYNLAYTIFGGTAPLMATWLIGATGSNLSPALYLILIALLGLIGGLSLPETSRIDLDEVSEGGETAYRAVRG
ncbi:MFS transporter [uncultured Pseudomonas sp.]|uniref:MFS transporter n=1 Tax=uncultured Pseudomonas sp. TaxID=114707 RepID=UPI002586843F|nr:MFS transporter [uncultured Pseudomonas sp.]